MRIIMTIMIIMIIMNVVWWFLFISSFWASNSTSNVLTLVAIFVLFQNKPIRKKKFTLFFFRSSKILVFRGQTNNNTPISPKKKKKKKIYKFPFPLFFLFPFSSFLSYITIVIITTTITATTYSPSFLYRQRQLSSTLLVLSAPSRLSFDIAWDYEYFYLIITHPIPKQLYSVSQRNWIKLSHQLFSIYSSQSICGPQLAPLYLLVCLLLFFFS